MDRSEGIARLVLLSIVAFAATACATASGAEERPSAPELVGCTASPAIPGAPNAHVRLRFTVDEQGRVVPGTMRVSHTLTTAEHPSAAAVAEARAMAQGCVFEPGRLAGHPVRTQVTQTFRVPVR